MANIQLPFNLPANLRVTQLLGDSPAHRTGNAIDLEPLISNVDHKTAVRIYVQTFAALVVHMKRGILRINTGRSCWHYHYYLGDRDEYAYGFENYEHITTTTMVNGKPVKSTGCKQVGQTREFDMRYPLAFTQFTANLAVISQKLAGYMPVSGIEIFLQLISGAIASDKLDLQDPTYVYYDSAKFAPRDVERLLDNFSQSIVWTPTGVAPTIYSPGQLQDKAQDLLLIGLLGALGYGVISRLLSDKK